MSIQQKIGDCLGKDGKYENCGATNVPIVSNRGHCMYYSQKHKADEKKKRDKDNGTVKKKEKLRKPTGELAMFLEIWNEMGTPRNCEHCGRPQLVFRVDCFAHIKPKGTHPELRLKKDNIWFSCSYWSDTNGWYGCHTSETFESKEKFNALKNSYKG